MSQDKNILPFPIDGKTSPIPRALTDDKSTVYYINLPIRIFRPALNRLCDGNSSRIYSSHMSILTMLIHLFQCELSQTKDQMLENGLPRLAMYMEYLIPRETRVNDPATFTCPIIGCIGIRFIFVVNDPAVDIPVMLSDDISERKERLKKAKKKSTAQDISRLYNYFDQVASLSTWIDDSLVYLNKEPPMTPEYSKYIFEETKLNVTSELFPANVFQCGSGSLDLHDLQSQYDDENIAFSFPHLAFRIPSFITSPIAILAMTLPFSSKWVNQNDAKRKETLQILHNSDTLNQYYVSGYVKQNDLIDLKAMFDARLHIVEENQDMIMHETIKGLQDIWSTDAHVSTPIKLMSKWCIDLKTWTTSMAPIYDARMSYFGNMIAEDMLSFETELQIATAHTIFLKLLISSMNAYWYKKGKLHINLLLLGSGATGKSFVFDTLQSLLIEDTVTKVSHQTDKAMTVDSDRNDHITIYHECPPAFLGVGTKGSDQQTGSHLIKDMLTSCEVKTDTIFVDSETQRRYSVTCSSECVGVIFMATNERVDVIPEALSSRTMKIQVNNLKRDLFSVQSKSNYFNNMNGKDSQAVKMRWRLRQCMVNMVEKMIYVGILQEPNMCVADVVFTKVINTLKTKGIMTENADSVRNLNFIQMFTRSLTILHAVDKFARDPNSEGYNKPIRFQYLKAIQPYLICTEEIALFALTLLHDQLIDSIHFRVMELVLLMFSKNMTREGNFLVPRAREDFGNRAKIYSILYGAQAMMNLKMTISAENLKVGFNQLTKEFYKGEPVLYIHEESRTLKLNAHYVDTNFHLNPNGIYVCTVSPSTVITDTFQEVYCHKYFESGRTFITGTVVDMNFPFLFGTATFDANQQNMIEIHDASANFRDQQSLSPAYQTITKSLEEVACENKIHPIRLYDYPGFREVYQSSPVYPNQLITNFAYTHGVTFVDMSNTLKYGSLDEIIRRHSNIRKRKIDPEHDG